MLNDLYISLPSTKSRIYEFNIAVYSCILFFTSLKGLEALSIRYIINGITVKENIVSFQLILIRKNMESIKDTGL
ncbi:MAG: hypothetical protein BWX78_01798 [Firmicutes bacterium ADurb.Bin099]|nr:MAG: hypothetical protein BWX78_01798 [Firmicutes bacterium ADurb.Bin099]